jgi:hypothetical protein
VTDFSLAPPAIGANLVPMDDADAVDRIVERHLTRRELAVRLFVLHATAVSITVGMAIVVWVVRTLAGHEPSFFFPVIPLAAFGPFVALHAYRVFHSYPDEADEPLRLPFVIERSDPEYE